MAINLFGEKYESLEDYAKRLITVGYNQPTYKIRIRGIDYYPTKGLQFDLIDNDDNIIKDTNCSGIYSIWEGMPKKDNCLYVGGSVHGLRQRIYRFIKELCDVSRPDESHPAGKKCRYHKINPHNLYVKFLRKEDFPEMINEKLVMKNDNSIEQYIDEYVAPQLKSRFNKKVKK